MTAPNRLTEKSAAVLGLIADGLSYAQIVDRHPEITYLDIFAAAEEALRLNESESDYHQRMAEIKRRHPRAYERWSEDEEHHLIRLMKDETPIKEIAHDLQRQPSAIRSRLIKLGLISSSE